MKKRDWAIIFTCMFTCCYVTKRMIGHWEDSLLGEIAVAFCAAMVGRFIAAFIISMIDKQSGKTTG